MRPNWKSVTWMFLFLLAVPASAISQGRYYREEGRESAYHAGYDRGYQDGVRQGRYDISAHFRYNNHIKGNWSRNYNDARYQGEYRKGFKDGYRTGYDSGYRSYVRNPPRRWFY